MTYALFDDAGRFLAGRVMSESDTSVQVELDSGRRVKVKSAHVLMRFDAPAPHDLMAGAEALSTEIDLDLAWEFAPEEDFGFTELADDYFGSGAGAPQQAAALLRLFDAPHYFRRVGKGRFRKAPQETVRAALLALERRNAVAAQVDAWADELAAGTCPPPVREQLYRILFRPDKNAPEYKAVVQAARATQRAPLDLLQGAGAIDSPYQFHWRRFLSEQFPQGTAFPAVPVPPAPDGLPLAAVRAFSIDDSATTEIDDALSVTGLGQGRVVFGIHIAAPALAIAPDSVLDRIARERLSTVYLPGWKVTMLPDDVVEAYTLVEGRDCPALSLYLTFDEETLTPVTAETRIERVPIVANLRHDQLDDVVTEATLTGEARLDVPFAAELAFAWRLARHRQAERERVRGRPETFGRPDYQFRLDGTGDGPPTGEETVRITPRRRGAPLDLIVAEAMILANSHWGGWLAECGVPGLYRSQASLAPGVKVRMGTKPLPHAGMGVPQYAWSTSPLRRYVDLVNQWQIIACVRHGRTAALAAPFRPKDASLFSILSAFDAAYTAYHAFQHAIERFWTLRWLQQHEVSAFDAAVLKDGLVRAEGLPLVLRAAGAEGLARGTRVSVRIVGIDLLTLEAPAVMNTRLGELDDVRPSPADAQETGGDSGEDDDSEDASSALSLAIDVDDGAVPPAAPSAS